MSMKPTPSAELRGRFHPFGMCHEDTFERLVEYRSKRGLPLDVPFMARVGDEYPLYLPGDIRHLVQTGD